MAAYPDIPILLESTREWLDGRIVERTAGGTARARVDWTGIRSRWQIVHLVNETEAALVFDHWAAHLDSGFDFTFKDVTYTVIYGPAGVQEQFLGGPVQRLMVELVEV